MWEQVRRCSEVILVEGLFDYALVWQAGFRNVTCSLGNHLNGPIAFGRLLERDESITHLKTNLAMQLLDTDLALAVLQLVASRVGSGNAVAEGDI